jgi:hypothetical protein
MEHEVNTTSKSANVPVHSAKISGFAQAYNIPQKFTIRGMRMPKPWQLVTRIVPSQHTRDRLRSKAKLASPHLLVLLAGLAYIIATFTVVSIGLKGISGNLNTRLEDATIELQAQVNLKYRENILESQVDKLLRTLLNGKFMETYEDCLARGVREGNTKLFGLGFQYPAFRDKAMDWTIENCGRLHHAPQIIETSPQQNFLTGWTQINCRGHPHVNNFFAVVTRRANILQIWLFSKTGAEFLKPTEHAVPDDQQLPTCAKLPARKLMPTGFDLRGKRSPCRLVYVHNKGTPTDKATVSNDALADSKRKVQDLFRAHHHLDALRKATATIAVWLMPLELLCFMAYVIGMLSSGFAESSLRTDRRETDLLTIVISHVLTEQEQCAAICILAQIIAKIAGMCMERSFPLGWFTIMDVGVFVISCSVPMIVQALIPIMVIADFPRMYKATRQLYRIAMQPDVLAFQAAIPLSRTKGDCDISKDTRITRQPRANKVSLNKRTSPASSSLTKPSARGGSVSHTKTLDQEIWNETQSVERSYKVWADLESNSDSDGEEYVDLAGGISPTIIEDLDWSVVDA